MSLIDKIRNAFEAVGADVGYLLDRSTYSYASMSELDGSDDVEVGDRVAVAGREYDIVAAGTRTANGYGVVDLTTSGHQAVIVSVAAASEETANLETLVEASKSAGVDTKAAVRGLWNNVAAPYHFSRIERVRPEWGGAVGDGDTANAAINKTALEAAALYCQQNGLILQIPGGADYAFDSLTLPGTLALPLRLEGRGWSFQPTNSINNSDGTVDNNTSIIDLGAGLTADEIQIITQSGHSFDRLVDLGGGERIARLYLESLGQVYSSNTDKLDASVQFRGNAAHIGQLHIKNHDKAVALYQCNEFNIDMLITESFIRGTYIRGCDNGRIGDGRALDASPHLDWDGIGGTISPAQPGQNGFLFEGTSRFSSDVLRVENAAEHGVRLGGGNNAQTSFAHFDYSIGQIITRKTGQCGFKTHPGRGEEARQIRIGQIDVIDAAWANAAGTNEDGVRLEELYYSTIGGISVQAIEGGSSCYDGLFVCESKYVTVGYLDVRKAARDGLHIEAVDDGGGSFSGDVNDFFLHGGIIQQCSGDGVSVNGNDMTLRDIHVTNVASLDNGGTGWLVQTDQASSGANSPCVFHGWASGNGTEKAIGTGDPDIKDQVTTV